MSAAPCHVKEGARTTQLERIERMEAMLDRVAAANARLTEALDASSAALGDARELSSYYGGDLWRRDFADDEAGRLPRSLKRGVLAEDGAYNALAGRRELALRMRELAEEESQRRKEELLGGVTQARSADEIFKQMHEQDKLVLNLIVRADVQGSVEAIVDSINQIESTKVSCNVIQSGTGAIAVNDIERADHGKALVIGFNVSPESGVNALARHDGVRVQTFRIIYELIDFVKQEMLALLPVEHKEVVRGHAQVKQVFDLGKEGVVAGSLVLDGFITSKGQIRVVRRGKLLHTGPVSTIRHFKETVEEVRQAQECGIMLEGFREFEEGDMLECFAFEELPKSL